MDQVTLDVLLQHKLYLDPSWLDIPQPGTFFMRGRGICILMSSAAIANTVPTHSMSRMQSRTPDLIKPSTGSVIQYAPSRLVFNTPSAARGECQCFPLHSNRSPTDSATCRDLFHGPQHHERLWLRCRVLSKELTQSVQLHVLAVSHKEEKSTEVDHGTPGNDHA